MSWELWRLDRPIRKRVARRALVEHTLMILADRRARLKGKLMLASLLLLFLGGPVIIEVLKRFNPSRTVGATIVVVWLIVPTAVCVFAGRGSERQSLIALRKAMNAEGIPVCLECGYDLTRNCSGICPECGEPVPAHS